MPDPEKTTMPSRPARRWVALVFAVAALASSWNPIAAPFGLAVGSVAAVLAVLALRRGPAQRRAPAAALAMSVLAVVASIVVIALTAGSVGVELPGEPVVKGRTPAELDQVLSQAAERTRSRREQAAHELDAMRGQTRDGPGPVPGGRDAGVPARDSDRR